MKHVYLIRYKTVAGVIVPVVVTIPTSHFLKKNRSFLMSNRYFSRDISDR